MTEFSLSTELTTESLQKSQLHNTTGNFLQIQKLLNRSQLQTKLVILYTFVFFKGLNLHVTFSFLFQTPSSATPPSNIMLDTHRIVLPLYHPRHVSTSAVDQQVVFSDFICCPEPRNLPRNQDTIHLSHQLHNHLQVQPKE